MKSEEGVVVHTQPHSSQLPPPLGLLGSREKPGLLPRSDFHPRPQVLIPCIIHLRRRLGLAPSILPLDPRPRPSLHVPAKQS